MIVHPPVLMLCFLDPMRFHGVQKAKVCGRSSTKAEYRAVASTAVELAWLQSLLDELGINLTTTPTIYCDNADTTYLCGNHVFHSRMKHRAIDFSFVIKFKVSNYVFLMSAPMINLLML